jgi:cytochrome c oxidase assembly protein subunit 15
MKFAEGFHIARELGKTATGEGLSLQAMTAIHWVHRLGAVVITLWIAGLAWATARAGAPGLGLGLAGSLGLQVVLGLSNVWFGLPLPVAVLHNAGAAFLLIGIVVLNFRAHLAARIR